MSSRDDTEMDGGGLPEAAETPAAVRDPLFIESVARAMRVMEAFADQPQPLSLARLAQSAGIAKSAAQRIAHTLSRLGYLEQTRRGFVPGRKTLERTHDYLRVEPLVSRSIPILADLRREVNERVDMSLFDDTSMLYIVRLQSKRDTFHAHLIGRRVPTFCSSGGRAVMAALPDEAARALIARSERRALTPHTTVNPADVWERVLKARQVGFAVARQQVLVGEIAVGAAVLDADRRPVAALHVAGSLGEWEPVDFVRRVAPLAVAAANAISTS